VLTLLQIQLVAVNMCLR